MSRRSIHDYWVERFMTSCRQQFVICSKSKLTVSDRFFLLLKQSVTALLLSACNWDTTSCCVQYLTAVIAISHAHSQNEYTHSSFLEKRGGGFFLYPSASVCITLRKFSVWRCMHRASSYNMYINQQDAQNSCDETLFFNIRSTCFGLYQSIFRSNLFIRCTSYLVYADTSRCCVAIATQQPDVWYRHIPNMTYIL